MNGAVFSGLEGLSLTLFHAKTDTTTENEANKTMHERVKETVKTHNWAQTVFKNYYGLVQVPRYQPSWIFGQ